MSDVTRILSQIEQGDPQAAEQLLPLVYDELRKLAAAKLAHEQPGQTLQATALVHEAYLRLVGPGVSEDGSLPTPDSRDCRSATVPAAPDSRSTAPNAWNSRGHFFAASAEAMRRILVESARRKARVKHGGDLARQDIEPSELLAAEIPDDLLALDEALDRLAASDGQAVELVKLRYFAGLTIPQAAEALGISPRKADMLWSFARAWLRCEIEGSR
jgi:hypothetical protein